MRDDPALTFALTLKRWFRANGWPQKITDDWAKDAGIQNPTGPWASQVCNAMKAAGYNPKAEFFLALGEFNRFVAEQEIIRLNDSKLKQRLAGATALLHEDGQAFGGADFWSLYAGLLEPPEAFADTDEELTQEDLDEWVKLMRDNFRQVSLVNMCSRAEAWQMIHDAMVAAASTSAQPFGPDDLSWAQEVLAGLHDPSVEEAIRRAKAHSHSHPLQEAMEQLLGVKSKKPVLIA